MIKSEKVKSFKKSFKTVLDKSELKFLPKDLLFTTCLIPKRKNPIRAILNQNHANIIRQEPRLYAKKQLKFQLITWMGITARNKSSLFLKKYLYLLKTIKG